jgi:hypothetical protein
MTAYILNIHACGSVLVAVLFSIHMEVLCLLNYQAAHVAITVHAYSEMCINIIMNSGVPNTIFWDVTLCNVVNVSCYLREVCYGYLHGRRISAAWKNYMDTGRGRSGVRAMGGGGGTAYWS